MSQERILEILGGKPMTRAELQQMTELAQKAISQALHQLLKYNEIEKDCSKGKPIYQLKKKKRKKRRKVRPSPKNNQN